VADSAPEKTAPAVLVEPRYAKVMPWVLVAAAIVLGAVALAIRVDVHRSSVVTVESRAPVAPGARGGTPPGQLAPEKQTTTEQATSESTFSAILGIAAVLLLLGAFYTRVSKITVAGNTLELTPIASATQDAAAVGEEVAKQAGDKVREVSGEGNTLTVEQAVQIAEAAASAAARAQSEATRLRLAAAVVPVRATASASPLTIQPDELQKLSAGDPLPDSLLKKLSAKTFEDVGDG
jgi:hypothetical protein